MNLIKIIFKKNVSNKVIFHFLIVFFVNLYVLVTFFQVSRNTLLLHCYNVLCTPSPSGAFLSLFKRLQTFRFTINFLFQTKKSTDASSARSSGGRSRPRAPGGSASPFLPPPPGSSRSASSPSRSAGGHGSGSGPAVAPAPLPPFQQQTTGTASAAETADEKTNESNNHRFEAF